MFVDKSRRKHRGIVDKGFYPFMTLNKLLFVHLNTLVHKDNHDRKDSSKLFKNKPKVVKRMVSLKRCSYAFPYLGKRPPCLIQVLPIMEFACEKLYV